ncbi:MAG: sulfatase-like hydrolase/transferase, partial [Boseongicola sp.]
SLTLAPIGDIADLPPWHRQARREVGTDAATEAEYRKVLAIYYGMIRYIDEEMARLHAALDERGMLENTWIILGSDHGDYTGEKGLFNKSESLYKCLLHVPLIIVPPKGTTEPGPRTVEGMTSTIDLFPTILEIAGIEPGENQGKSLLDWVRSGHQTPLRDAIFAQIGDYHGFIRTSWPTGMPASGRHASLTHCIRTKTHAYILDPDNGDEAYDLVQDPNELHNLLNPDRPELNNDFKDLKQRLAGFIDECDRLKNRLGVVSGDRGFVEGWE